LLAHKEGAVPVVHDFFAQTPRRRRPENETEFYPVHADFGYATQEFHIGLGSVATPGVIAGLFDIHRRHGSLPMARLLEPAIRGARPGDNAYYIDDMEVSYLYHMGGLVSVLPADLVQDFNLFASAFSPQYDDVVGAVIDVALRDPRDDRLGGKVNVSLLASELLAEGPVTANQSFLFSARRSYFDLLVGEIEDEEEQQESDNAEEIED